MSRESAARFAGHRSAHATLKRCQGERHPDHQRPRRCLFHLSGQRLRYRVQRIRSTVFKAGNSPALEKHLTAQGFDLIPGDADGVLAINPAQNKNLLLEFTE